MHCIGKYNQSVHTFCLPVYYVYTMPLQVEHKALGNTECVEKVNKHIITF